MLEHKTVTDAAKAVGLHRRTVHRILARPQVVDEYKARRRELIDTAALRLRALAGEAVETLGRIMRDTSSPSASVSAARTVLQVAFEIVDRDDLAERVDALVRARGLAR
ncbi:MAG TPA: hypothetical protein VFA20_34220 [Myxococcaceae bacterium]|nr:hypothetical protein [Myxococcaceae bacterium]